MRGVRKSFAKGLARSVHRTLALSDVDLDLWPGEIVALAGPECAGKTTLLQCAAGLLRRDGGDMTWFGEAFAGGGCVPGVACVPAVPVFYPFLTVRDVLEYRAGREAIPRDRRAVAIDTALEQLALSAISGSRIAQLSRDDIKRLAVAEALVCEPVAILMDTATSDMCAAVSATTCAALELHAANGMAVMVAVRDPGDVAVAASRIVMLGDGHIRRSFSLDSPGVSAFPLLSSTSRFVAETIH